MRNRTEKMIAELLVEELLNSNKLVSVNDGEETTVRKSDNRKEIVDALGTTDSDTLEVFRPDGERVGYFWLIWGNGRDLISDYGGNNYNIKYIEDLADTVDEKLDAHLDVLDRWERQENLRYRRYSDRAGDRG